MHNQRKYQGKLGRGLSSSKVHSIPIFCAFALLLLGVSIMNPAGHETVQRVFADDTSTQTDNGASLTLSEETTGNIADDTKNTAYRSYTVQAKANSIESYNLSINYDTGSTSLKNSAAGATVINNVVSTGVLGSNMVNNTWGWGWSDNALVDNAAITYKPMLTTPSIIKSEKNPADNKVDLNGKLAFAAKFGEGATAGHYQANVLVSFAIEPKTITQYYYSVEYAFGSGQSALYEDVKLPETQMAASTDTSYTFVVQTYSGMVKVDSRPGAGCLVSSWLGNDGATYLPESNITLQSSSPSITLSSHGYARCEPV